MPLTQWGRLVGVVCAVFGVFIIGLPIPIITKSFNKFYAVVKGRQQAAVLPAAPALTSQTSSARHCALTSWDITAKVG